jgi:uncharacterized protein YuzE
MLMLDISIDKEYKLAYVKTGAGAFGRTIFVNDEINVDLDINGAIIGVEFLSFEILNRKVEYVDSKASELGPKITVAITEAQKEVKARLTSE